MSIKGTIKFIAAQACILLVAIFGLVESIIAADCGMENRAIALTSQVEVDDFQSTYGGGGICDRILGNLSIRGDDITDLGPLTDIREVVRLLAIENNLLLKNLNGLSGVETIGGALEIQENPILESTEGLANLATVGYTHYGDPDFHCWSIKISENTQLRRIDELSRLTQTNCDIEIGKNPNLENLDGLSGLVSIGGSLEVNDNTALSNIDGLSSVTEVGVGKGVISLRISDSLISNVDGLSSVQKAWDLNLIDNRLLSDCSGVLTLVDTVDDYEPGPGSGLAPDLEFVGDYTSALDDSVRDNAPGCNTVDEILAIEPISETNEGLTGTWYNPETNGQGVFITVYPRIREIFLSWFTYDVERPDPTVEAILGDPGHRWLTAQGPYPYLDPDIKMSVPKTAELGVWITEGGVFDSGEPQPTWEPDGTVFLEFETCSTATLTYEIPSISATGTIPLERVALDNVRRCYELDRDRYGKPTSID